MHREIESLLSSPLDEGVIIKRHGLIAFARDVFTRAVDAHCADNYQNVNPFYHRSWCNLTDKRELVFISSFMSIDFRQSDFQVHQIVQFTPRGGINYSEPYHSIKSGEVIFLAPCHFRLRLQVIYERNSCVRRFGSVQLHFW